jgi:hypothetical protein
MTSLTSCYQILDTHTIFDMLCSKWTSYHISGFSSMWYFSEKSMLSKQINDSIFSGTFDSILQKQVLFLWCILWQWKCSISNTWLKIVLAIKFGSQLTACNVCRIGIGINTASNCTCRCWIGINQYIQD